MTNMPYSSLLYFNLAGGQYNDVPRARLDGAIGLQLKQNAAVAVHRESWHKVLAERSDI